MKILVQATTRAGGDLNPVVALVRGLRDGGCELAVLADTPAAPIFSELGLPVTISSPDWEVGPHVKLGLQATAGQGHVERLAAVRERIEGWADDILPEARRLLERTGPDLILTSFFGTAIGSVLRRVSGLPWCAINSTFYIGPNPPRPLERDFSARAADVFRYSVIPYLEDASLVLHATDPLFDYDHRGMPPNHYYTGPLIWEAPGSLPAYVHEPGPPWLLATLSSLRQDDTPIARAAMTALAHTAHRLLVTIGPGHARADVAPVPANARVEQYVPHSPVMSQARLFIAHAGHGSVMKALAHGLPMVLVPWGRDQFGVAARAEQLGVAAVLPKEQLTVHAMAEAIDRVLYHEQYADAARAASQRLRGDDAVAGAVELILSTPWAARAPDTAD